MCSSGGHLAQLFRLRRWWEDHERVWVTFDTPDATSLLATEPVVGAHHPTTRNHPNALRNLAHGWRLLGADGDLKRLRLAGGQDRRDRIGGHFVALAGSH